MKHSIKRQVALIFIGLMAATLLICWMINNTFLQKYYEEERKKALIHTYEILDTNMQSNSFSEDSFEIEMEKISGKYNIMGVVQDTEARIIATFGNDMDMLKGLLWDRIYTPIKDPYILEETDRYTVQKVEDSKTRAEYMEMVGWLSEGQAFYIRTPLENIRESVKIANRFLFYVGLICIVISSIIIFYVTGKITQPILKLAEISERMTKLDFDAKYEGEQKSEIGLLGEHMNTLSETLESTIQELKNANIELHKDIENKEKIDSMRKEFLSNVSHELKTPIALIQGYAEGLQEGINDGAESREFYCSVIVDEANKMNQMVKKLMTLNELEFGKETVNFERFDVVALIRNHIQSAGILANGQDIQIRMEPSDPIYVWADEYMTEEVFTNYFTNALHYCGGEKIVEIRFGKEKGKVRISIFNTGNKIPEESIPYLWDKFYKVDKARTREYGGSGVGLSIVKAIMESMNQKYGVENYENGVAFYFELEMVEKEGS